MSTNIIIFKKFGSNKLGGSGKDHNVTIAHMHPPHVLFTECTESKVQTLINGEIAISVNKKDYLSMSSNSNNISSPSKNKIKVKDVLIGLNPNGYVQLLLKN